VSYNPPRQRVAGNQVHNWAGLPARRFRGETRERAWYGCNTTIVNHSLAQSSSLPHRREKHAGDGP
jgi:hypothetical protein